MARRSWASFVARIILGVLLAAGIIAIIAPTLMYQRRTARIPGGTLRGAGDSEVYSLRPSSCSSPVLTIASRSWRT